MPSSRGQRRQVGAYRGLVGLERLVVVPGARRRVNTTSLPEPSARTRIGTLVTLPSGSVTSWSATPYGLCGANRTSTSPIGEVANQRPSRSSMPELSPAAHSGSRAGSLT